MDPSTKEEYKQQFDTYQQEFLKEYKHYVQLGKEEARTHQKITLLSESHPDLFEIINLELKLTSNWTQREILTNENISPKEKKELVAKVKERAADVLDRLEHKEIMGEGEFQHELEMLAKIGGLTVPEPSTTEPEPPPLSAKEVVLPLKKSLLKAKKKILESTRFSHQEKKDFWQQVSVESNQLIDRLEMEGSISQKDFYEALTNIEKMGDERLSPRQKLFNRLDKEKFTDKGKVKYDPEARSEEKIKAAQPQEVLKDIVREFYRKLPEPLPEYTDKDIEEHMKIAQKILTLENECLAKWPDPKSEQYIREKIDQIATICLKDPTVNFEYLASRLEHELDMRDRSPPKKA